MKCIKCGVSIRKDSHCLECFKRAEESGDIQHIVNKDTSQMLRKRFAIGNLRSNTIRCKSCDIKIRSKNKQHHISCKCGGCSVDGGSNYQRIMGDNYEVLAQGFDDGLLFNTYKEDLLT